MMLISSFGHKENTDQAVMASIERGVWLKNCVYYCIFRSRIIGDYFLIKGTSWHIKLLLTKDFWLLSLEIYLVFPTQIGPAEWQEVPHCFSNISSFNFSCLYCGLR